MLLIRAFCFIFIFPVAAIAARAESTNGTVEPTLIQPILGTWLNETEGNVVGLQLISADRCDLFIERLLQPRTTRACKYQGSVAGGYALFLVGKNGECGSEPDFEFTYDPQAPLIRLNLGATDILLRKVDN